MSALGVSLRGKIPAGDRIEPGRALARLTDLGWGGPLRDIFRPGEPDAEITPAMTKALVRVLSEWEWEQRPVAIVAMPSRTHPRLVSSVAAALAQAGRLPWIGTLELTGTGPANNRGNSAYRLAGVIDSFAVGDDLRDQLAQLTPGPVLLIDDLIDSRWSLTVAGRLLRQAGAGTVLPLALAVSG